jgi:hypothetical protein
MLSLAALLAFLLSLLPSIVSAASLDRDWARIYNPPGTESVLGMWPAPGGGVDIAVDHAGELVYIQYDQDGNLAAERSTVVDLSGMLFRVFASDQSGGFIAAALNDTGMVSLRISAEGQMTWRNQNTWPILYPSKIEVKGGKVFVGGDLDYGSSYDPFLTIFDLGDGANLGENMERAYFFRISDIEVLENGGVLLVGFDNSGCDCSTWIRTYDGAGNLEKTSAYPGHSFAQIAHSVNWNVLLTTSVASLPLERASFAVTWFHPIYDVPQAYADSRDFMQGGCRAEIFEELTLGLFLAGEHDAGSGEQELILGSADFGGVDADFVRPNSNQSYDALQLAAVNNHVVMLARQTNVGGGSPARTLLLFDENRILQDHDVEGNISNPISMAIGSDGGIYTVGSGPSGDVVLTKLLISGVTAVAGEAQAAPRASRLGIPTPNPATSSVRVDYEVSGNAATTLEIYDPAGRLVERLVEGTPSSGQHVAEWDTRRVAKGVYFVRFKSGNSYATRKIVIE